MDDMKKELQVIQELMEQLQDKMQYGEDDLSERLGRKKPGIEVMKIEGKMPMGNDPMQGDDSPMAEMDAGPDAMGMDDEMDESPDDKLKKRLMAMRG